MKRYLVAIAVSAAFTVPASAQLTSQQQRMKDCNTQASGTVGMRVRADSGAGPQM